MWNYTAKLILSALNYKRLRHEVSTSSFKNVVFWSYFQVSVPDVELKFKKRVLRPYGLSKKSTVKSTSSSDLWQPNIVVSEKKRYSFLTNKRNPFGPSESSSLWCYCTRKSYFIISQRLDIPHLECTNK